MKAIITVVSLLAIQTIALSQEEPVEVKTEEETVVVTEEGKTPPDTTRINLRNMEVIIVEKDTKSEHEEDFDEEDIEDCSDCGDAKGEAHWAGVDFGVTMLMDNNFNNTHPDYPYWNNDVAKSQVWNLNLLEHKFDIAQQYFGLTTGLGFSFTSVAFKDNYVLSSTPDTLFAVIDSATVYSKNKLKATYLTVPLLLEFCTNKDASKSFYLATGVVGGLRIASKTKRIGEIDGREFKEKVKGTYDLNPFKLDATARIGYGSVGAFASYSLLPLFDTGKTMELYPLSFGLTMNF